MSRALRAVAAASALALGLTACTGDGEPTGPPAPQGPIEVAHTDAVISEAVAAVIERHLRNQGHQVADSEAVPQPWTRTDETTVAVVDTLAYALQVAPDQVMPAPPQPTPTASPSSPGTASPSAGGAGSSATPSGTPTPTPTPLPNGTSAMSADKVDRLIEQHLAAEATQRREAAGSASPTPSDGASAPASGSSSSGPSDEVTVFAPSAGTLRLTALVTATTASRLGLERIDDLNVLCEPLTAAARVDVNSEARSEATRLLRERLDRLAGCRPHAWRPAYSAVTGDLVYDRAQVGFAYGIDPALEDDALVALTDSGRVLPEGRMSVLGEAEHIPKATRDEIKEVMGRMDSDGLTALQELVSGPDALSPDEAAQYWLVDRGLEDAPDGWVVPQQGWF